MTKLFPAHSLSLTNVTEEALPRLVIFFYPPFKDTGLEKIHIIKVSQVKGNFRHVSLQLHFDHGVLPSVNLVIFTTCVHQSHSNAFSFILVSNFLTTFSIFRSDLVVEITHYLLFIKHVYTYVHKHIKSYHYSIWCLKRTFALRLQHSLTIYLIFHCQVLETVNTKWIE